MKAKRIDLKMKNKILPMITLTAFLSGCACMPGEAIELSDDDILNKTGYKTLGSISAYILIASQVGASLGLTGAIASWYLIDHYIEDPEAEPINNKSADIEKNDE